MRNFLILFTCAVFMGTAQAERFDKRFEPGYELLEKGEYDQALEAFEQLKTDNPDSELVDYSIASVFYKKALSMQQKEADVPKAPPGEINLNDAELKNLDPISEKVKEEFSKAKGQFESIGSTSNSFLREQEVFHCVNDLGRSSLLLTRSATHWMEEIDSMVFSC